MLITAEVRWFYPGVVPSAITQWFVNELGARDPFCKSWSPRSDHYLRIPQCDHIGAKLRDGGDLEIKVKLRSLGETRLSNQVRGSLEHWCKVGMGQPWLARGDRFADNARLWAVVEKTRTQRKYAVTNDATEPTAVDAMIPKGAAIELTEIRFAAEQWWTLGFEAFSPDCELVDTFDAVVKHVMASYSGGELDAAHSYGYPAWLAAVSRPV